MASVIDTIIPVQAFEIVRDRIGRILTEELANQVILSGNTDLDVKSWIERILPFDKIELPSINVTMGEGAYGGQTVIQSDGTYRFFVDAYVNAFSRDNEPGDIRAMLKLQRLLGVCRAIIEDARYKTLGFAPPFIMNRHIESIQIQNPNQKRHDADSSVMGRLTVSVKIPEITAYKQPVNGTLFTTSIRLYETNMGYLWTTDNGYDTYDYAFDSN